MEVPATEAGVVKELKVKVGDRVSEGSAIMVMETTDEAAEAAKSAELAQAVPQKSKCRFAVLTPRSHQWG